MEYADFQKPLRKALYNMLKAALVAAGHSEDKYSVLAPDCFSDRKEVECRKSKFVEYYLHALANNINLATIPDVMECELINSDDTAVI